MPLPYGKKKNQYTGEPEFVSPYNELNPGSIGTTASGSSIKSFEELAPDMSELEMMSRANPPPANPQEHFLRQLDMAREQGMEMTPENIALMANEYATMEKPRIHMPPMEIEGRKPKMPAGIDAMIGKKKKTPKDLAADSLMGWDKIIGSI